MGTLARYGGSRYLQWLKLPPSPSSADPAAVLLSRPRRRLAPIREGQGSEANNLEGTAGK